MVQDNEQKLFEKWITKGFNRALKENTLEINAYGVYMSQYTDCSWEVWQARAQIDKSQTTSQDSSDKPCICEGGRFIVTGVSINVNADEIANITVFDKEKDNLNYLSKSQPTTIQSEPVACVTYKQVISNGATTTDKDLCITPYESVNKLGLGTKLYTKPQSTSQDVDVSGWKEASVAWAVCASIHREYCKGKDVFYTKRQSDFINSENICRTKYADIDGEMKESE